MKIEDTIDAFIDGMTVDPHALDAALASVEGRAYLLDALALRGLVTQAPGPAARRSAQHPADWNLATIMRAAVIAITLLGAGYAAGYFAPERRKPVARETTQRAAAPEPTRVIELNDLRDFKGGD